MAFEPHPWFIGLEGVEHSAEVARMLAWAATNGASGIITPNDLKVVAQSVPSDSVVIRPGGFVVESKFAGASQQSYVERAPTSTTLEVPATGSSGGATRYVVARITDPDYPGGGTIPPVPNDGSYAAPYLVSSLSSSRTEIPLAKIVQPANTAAITNAMITDLREVANPRTKPELRTYALLAEDTEKLSTVGADSNTGETWPRQADTVQTPIDIPTWATRARIVQSWAGVTSPATVAQGRLWVQIGGDGNPNNVKTQTVKYRTSSQSTRDYMMVADMVWIPPELRGTSQKFIPRGNRESSSSGQLTVDGASVIVTQIEFLERAN